MIVRDYLLNEIFDSKPTVTVTKSEDDEIMTSFVVDGEKYYFSGSEYEDGYYVVMFYRAKGMFDMKGDSKYINKIIGGVFGSIHLMLHNRSVQYIGLSTDNPKLISVYDNIVKYFEKNVKGFKLYKREEVTNGMIKWVYRKVI